LLSATSVIEWEMTASDRSLRQQRSDRGTPAGISHMDMEDDVGVSSFTGPVAGALLAAGSSRRMRGLNKLIVPVRGEPALAKICAVALRTELSPVIVVLGHEGAKVRESLEHLLKEHASRLRFVVNADYLEGRTSSIRAAVRALPAECDAVMFLRGDQPWVSETLIGDLVRVFREKKAALAFPVCRGRKGSPTIFARSHFGKLLDLRGDRGTLHLAEDLWDEAAKLEVEDARCLTGIDTREDLDRLSP